MRTSRHRFMPLAVAATALTLTLTACQDGSGTKSSSPAASSAPEASSPQSTGTSGGSTGSSSPAGSKASAGSTGGSAGSAGDQVTVSTPVCTAGDVRVTAATQDGPPFTHIVLTAKNTTGHSCRLTGFPHIQFLESHKQDVAAVAGSKPAAPVVLAAGAPAYALVKLSDGGVDEDNEPVSAFSLTLEDDSTVIAVTAPGGNGIAVDPAKALTGYWTPELRDGADDF